MSGGSFNYLYCHVNGLENQRGDIESMRDRLVELGYDQAAAATQRVLAFLDRAEQEATDLYEVWHAVEWLDSMDWSHGQMAEVLEEYRQLHPTAPTPAVADAPPVLLGWRWVAPDGTVYALTPESAASSERDLDSE